MPSCATRPEERHARGRRAGREPCGHDRQDGFASEERRHAGFIKNNLRTYGMLLSLFAIMLFFQVMTDGTLLQPLNLTNLVLQNSYIVIMALGMLLVIVDRAYRPFGRLGRRLRGRGRRGADGPLSGRLSAGVHRLPAGRRGDRGGAGLLGRLFRDSFLHRHAGRHAGLQGPCARAAAGPVRGAVSGNLPEAVVGLHPGAAS